MSPIPELHAVASQTPEHAGLTRQPHRIPRWILPVAIGALVGVGLLVLVGSTAVRAAPIWWRTIIRDDPELVRLAKDTEKRITNRLFDTQATNDPWTIEIDAPSANAWLNARLPLWLANQKDEFRWPQEMTNVQVAFEDRRVIIGAGVRINDDRGNGREQVLTATLDPYVDTDGKLWLPATGVSLGRLDIPGPLVISTVRGRAQRSIPERLRTLPETAMLFHAFAGESPIINTAVFRLGDGRRVRVLAIDVRKGALTLTCQTERE